MAPFSNTTVDTMITTGDDGVLVGPSREPRNLLGDQEYDGHASLHDETVAGELGLAGAPIEGPTHFSQFDPLAFEMWGPQWFESGCISAHFLNMVFDGESVTASVAPPVDGVARIDAVKADGSPVLTGTVSVDPDAPTELGERLEKVQQREPGDLFIVDQVELGPLATDPTPVSIDLDTPNGALYPFSLRSKLDAITERCAWYDSGSNPWGRPIVPFEMFSVLAHKVANRMPVRGPSVGLFIDLEVRAVDGPLFVGEDYLLEREVVAVGQSRRVESHWVRTTIRSTATGQHAATVLLHSGVFKASYEQLPRRSSLTAPTAGPCRPAASGRRTVADMSTTSEGTPVRIDVEASTAHGSSTT